jgi:putative transposase
VPRDRDGTFDPVIVRKRQRRLDGIDQIVLSLSARGLTTGEISAHFAEVYGASVGKDTISRITDAVVEVMAEWLPAAGSCLPGRVHRCDCGEGPRRASREPAVLRGHRRHRERRERHPRHLGRRGGEGAKYWLSVLTEIKNRGVADGLHGRVRRPEGSARRDRRDVAAGPHPDLRAAPDPQHLPLRLSP